MRAFHPCIALAALAAVVLVGASATPSFAGDDFEVTVAKGQVTVTARGAWHINPEYPWALVVGTSKLDRSRFTFAEKTAVVRGAPAGTGTIRGAVCSAGRCRSLSQAVTIP